MKEKNFSSYQLDLEYIDTVKEKGKSKEVYKSRWDSEAFKNVLQYIFQLEKQDRKRKYTGWFSYLHDLKIVRTDDSEDPDETEGVDYLVGRLLYAEYGYKGRLVHADSMDDRENDKSLREGEEKYVYFYVRLKDGLLLLQGDQKVTRAKIEDYLTEIGKSRLKSGGYENLSVRTLLREDFYDEIDKLDQVRLVEVEIQTEKTSSYENEAVVMARQQATEVEANYASVIMRSKYRQQGLKNIAQYIKDFKPTGTSSVASGVKNIKVVGSQNGELRRVYLDKIAEKYKREIETNENNQLKKESAYEVMKGIGEDRAELWRE